MKYIKAIIGSLVLIATLAQAEESALNKAKDGALQLWNKTKETTIEILRNTSKKTSEVGSKASDFGNKASKNAKETGAIVWDKIKEAGTATAEDARKGVSKIKQLVNEDDCKKDSVLCSKDKQ